MERSKPLEGPLPVWFNTGNCTELGMDAGIMVPEVGDEEQELQAKVVCIECPIDQMCLAWALKNRRSDLGVYGGKTTIERERLIRNGRRERGRGRRDGSQG